MGAASTGISFTLANALKDAEKLDKHFSDWVNQSVQIESKLRTAFDTKGGGGMTEFTSGLRDLQSLIKQVSGSNLSVNVDSTKVEQMTSALDKIVKYVDLLDGFGNKILIPKAYMQQMPL